MAIGQAKLHEMDSLHAPPAPYTATIGHFLNQDRVQPLWDRVGTREYAAHPGAEHRTNHHQTPCSTTADVGCIAPSQCSGAPVG